MKFKLTEQTRQSLDNVFNSLYNIKYSIGYIKGARYVSFDERLDAMHTSVKVVDDQLSAAEFINRYMEGDLGRFRLLLQCVADPALCVDIQNFDSSKRFKFLEDSFLWRAGEMKYGIDFSRLAFSVNDDIVGGKLNVNL